MNRILLIDRGDSSVHNFKKTLANKGLTLINEQTASRAFPYLNDRSIDLILIGSSLSQEIAGSRRFKSLAAGIPTIFLYEKLNTISRKYSSKSQKRYSLKEPLTFMELNKWMGVYTKQKASDVKKLRLMKELDTSQKALRFFNDATRTYINSSELTKILHSIMDKARITVSASAWSILIDKTFARTIPIRASKAIKKVQIEKGKGLAGTVFGKNRPLNILNVSADKQFDIHLDGVTGMKVKTIMCAPIKIMNDTVGVVRLLNKTGDESFSDSNFDLLKAASRYIEMSIERVLLYKKIEKLSVTDELTDLYNFRYLNHAISIELERGKRYGSVFSLIFMDIDDFKKVNERFGHQVGSKILIAVASLLRKGLRQIDVISRYGGDEFVMILPQTPREEGFMVAERLRKAMARAPFLKDEGLKIRLTASFGVASYPDNANNKDELLKIADKAMFSGKFSTKNIVFAAK